MGARSSKPAVEAMSAAAVQARRQAVARAAQPQGPPPGVTIEGTGPSTSSSGSSSSLSPPSLSPSAAAPPSRSGQFETDDALIKIMNELGPAIKTTRMETPRKDMNKIMFAHQEKPYTLPEETLAAILRSRREMPDKFDLGQVCETYGLKKEEMEKVLSEIEVPRIVERKGDKYGYWE